MRLWSNQSYPILYRVKGNVVSERKESGISVTGKKCIKIYDVQLNILLEQSHLPCRKRNFLLNPERHDSGF